MKGTKTGQYFYKPRELIVTESDIEFMGSHKMRTLPLYGTENSTPVFFLHLFRGATSVFH